MDEIMPGKTVKGNLMMLNKLRLTNTTLAVNFSLPLSIMKLPNETIVMISGAHIHKNVLDMLSMPIFFK